MIEINTNLQLVDWTQLEATRRSSTWLLDGRRIREDP